MKPRLPAIASIIIGVAGAALVAVVWPIAIPLGIFAVALVAVTFLLRPTETNDKRLAVGGLVLGLLAIVLGAAVAITDNGSSDAKVTTNDALTFVDGIATSTPDAAHPPQKD